MKSLSRKNQCLTAGILYLIVIFTGLFSELGVREAFFSPDQLSNTIQNWESNSFFLRMGIASDMVMVLADIGLAWVFWALFKNDFPELSILAASFRIVQAAMIGTNLNNLIEVILVPIDSITLNTLYSSLEAHRLGYLISGIPFGVCCILLAFMMVKSSWFSKILGWMVGIAGIAYLVDSFTQLLFPEYGNLTEILILSTAVITELTLCIYLLWNGIKKSANEISPFEPTI